MAKTIDLIRHTDNDGDALSTEGVEAACDLAERLEEGYSICVSTGAQRATQTIACILAGLRKPVPEGVIVVAGLRSDNEDRWREIAGRIDGSELAAFRSADREFAAAESSRLGEALGSVFDRLADGERALVVGHSPTNEAAVAGLTGQEVDPMSKGAGVRITRSGEEFTVEEL